MLITDFLLLGVDPDPFVLQIEHFLFAGVRHGPILAISADQGSISLTHDPDSMGLVPINVAILLGLWIVGTGNDSTSVNIGMVDDLILLRIARMPHCVVAIFCMDFVPVLS